LSPLRLPFRHLGAYRRGSSVILGEGHFLGNEIGFLLQPRRSYFGGVFGESSTNPGTDLKRPSLAITAKSVPTKM
jgi:hypothetical protein